MTVFGWIEKWWASRRMPDFLGICLACLMLICVSGCSGDGLEIAPVTGRVTVGGKPIENLIIIMQPVDGRASQGVTDADGKYVMRYTVEKWGVKVGSVGVWIDPLSTEMLEGESALLFKQIPKSYFKSFDELAIDGREQNVFDFDLVSK